MSELGETAARQEGTDTGASTAVEGSARTDAFVVRQYVAAGRADDLRDRIEAARPADGTAAATDWLLAGEDVATVSLFWDRRERASPALYWYVEVTDGSAWGDPAATLSERSPLVADLDDLLVGAPRVFGTDEEIVHAHNPARPGTPVSPDVVLVRVGIRPGFATTLFRGLVGAIDRLDDTPVGRQFEKSSVEVLEEERMWTETLWLDADDEAYDGHSVLWYMEAEDMDVVTDAYEQTDNVMARWSELVLNHLFEQPMALLGDPRDASGYELLAHATNPTLR